jgi:hypothetical protein
LPTPAWTLTLSATSRFLNIHYYAAAATKYGTLAKGGYEYDGNSYDAMFAHVEGYETCNECHNPHTLELKLEECAACHADDELEIETVDDLKNIRMQGSGVDYDGDDDTDEGIYFEIEGLKEALLANIQVYANEVAGTASATPRTRIRTWYIDANGDGEFTEDEASADGNALPVVDAASAAGRLQLSGVGQGSGQLCAWWQVHHSVALRFDRQPE